MPGVTNTPGLFRSFFTQKELLRSQNVAGRYPTSSQSTQKIMSTMTSASSSQAQQPEASMPLQTTYHRCKGLFFVIYAGYCPPSLWLCHDQTSKWHLSSRCKIVSNIFRVQPYEQPTPSWINSHGRLFVYIMLFVVHTSSAKCGPSCNIYGMKS